MQQLITADQMHAHAAAVSAAENARLREALQALMAGSVYKDIGGDADWHEIAMPTRVALNLARAALKGDDPEIQRNN